MNLFLREDVFMRDMDQMSRAELLTLVREQAAELEKLRLIIRACDQVKIGITLKTLDKEPKIIWANRRELEMHGNWSLEEVEGQPASIFGKPEMKGRYSFDGINPTFPLERESINVCGDKEFPVMLKGEIVEGPDGAPEAVVTTCENIAESRRREAALNLIPKLMQIYFKTHNFEVVLRILMKEIGLIMDVFSLSLWGMSADDTEMYCDRASGPGAKDHNKWKIPIGTGTVGIAAQSLKSVLIEDTADSEIHFKSFDEESGYVVRSILSVPLVLHKKLYYVLSLVDLEAHRFSKKDQRMIEAILAQVEVLLENIQLYESLQKQNIKLQEMNASKDKFFSIISHDLRAPFNALLGHSQMLKQKALTYTRSEIAGKAERIERSADRLYTLLENLLTWSRIQRGLLKCEPEPFDMYELGCYIEDLFIENAELKQVNLVNSLGAGTMVFSDYSMINTVLRNLVSNALKFTPASGCIEISSLRKGDYWEISVSDSGRGIKDEDIQKLFRIDVQFSEDGINGETGTGLGLILCQEHVEKNGGQISVESELGKGTIFRFTLPVLREE